MGNDILEVKKMLEALLKSDGLVEWVGGYVCGRTSNDDPFIILYPAADHLKEKICRVYPHQFKRLPDFIPTGDIPGDTDANPSKGQAQRAGIYHECRPFKVVMHLGKETQMGREKRFSDVLYIPRQQSRQQSRPATGNVASATADTGTGKSPPNQPPANPPDDEDEIQTHWRVQAATAGEPFIFDTAMVELSPWFRNSTNVKKFREALFGKWDPNKTGGYVVALEEYAAQRVAIASDTEKQAPQAHELAKERALQKYRQEVKE
jgi:hypothetical protein